MSDNAPVARQGEAAPEPSWMELLDPAALEARLTEARARRAEAISKRLAAGETAGARSQGARIRTLELAGSGSPAPQREPSPRPPVSEAPVLKSVPAPPRAMSEFAASEITVLGGARRRPHTDISERLAAVIEKRPAPVALPAEAAVARRRPSMILVAGLLVGAVVAGGAYLAARASLPDAGAPVQTAAIEPASSGPELRFGMQSGTAASAPGFDLSFASPGAGAASVPVLAIAVPAIPADAVVPVAALPQIDGFAPGDDRQGIFPVSAGPVLAALPSVAALPALDLAADARTLLPEETTAPVGLVGISAPGVKAAPDAGAPDLPEIASPAPLPSIVAEAAALVVAAASPGSIRSAAPLLRFATVAPGTAVRAALVLPGGVVDAPATPEYVLLEPPAAGPEVAVSMPRRANPAPAPAATARAPAATVRKQAAAPQASATRAPQASAKQAPQASAKRVAQVNGANRDKVERAVETLLRDRLFGN